MSNSNLCGCGREIRYMTPSGDACNKYRRCLTYDEQNELIMKLNMLVMAYQSKRSVDGLNGRKWDASEHFKAEAAIESIEKAMAK